MNSTKPYNLQNRAYLFTDSDLNSTSAPRTPNYKNVTPSLKKKIKGNDFQYESVIEKKNIFNSNILKSSNLTKHHHQNSHSIEERSGKNNFKN